jgi:hypothetical protein
LTICKAVDLDVTNTPPLESREWCRVEDEEIEPRHSPAPLHWLLSRRTQPATERLARLKTAIARIRTSIDPAWVAVTLLMAVMFCGFTWLSTKLNRIEAKLDAASLKVAEMPGTVQDELQAQTDKLAALINTPRQSGSAAPPGGGVMLTHGGVPTASNTRAGTSVAQVVNIPTPAMPGHESRASTTIGAGSGAKNGSGATNPATTSIRSRP